MRRRRRYAEVILVAIAMTLSLHSQAIAQNQDFNLDIRTDLERDRLDLQKSDRYATTPRQRTIQGLDTLRGLSFTPQEPAPTPQPFALDVTIPFTYNSNALTTERDPREDGHATPDLTFSWTHDVDRLRFSLLADLRFDRFVSVSDASRDTLLFIATIAYRPATTGPAIYARYSPILNFAPTLGQRQATFNDFILGMFWSEQICTVLCEDPDAKHKPVSLDFDISGGYRASDPSIFNSAFATMKVKVAYTVLDTISLSLQPQLRLRLYESFQGKSRQDITPGVALAAFWQPSWFKQHPLLKDPGTGVSAIISFTRNFSSLDNRSFSQWDVGPAIKFAWKF